VLAVMMSGPPGSGKSTLADGLVAALGPRTFHFGEDALFEIEEFADVAHGFRTKVFPDTAMMLDAYGRFIEHTRAAFDVVVFDWACAGMIEDLPCAQPDRTSVTTLRPEMRSDPDVLSSHARDVRDLVEDAVLFVLDAPIATAIGRAHAQRGEEWFDGYRAGIEAIRSDEPFLDAAIRYWEAASPRHDDCVRAHEAGGWDVIRLDASASASDVLKQAMRQLRRR
jgi:hypothetical protein